MYTALQWIALTQAVRFERFKNPVLLLLGPAAWWAPLHCPAHLQCWRANLGFSVLGCGHRRPLILVRDSLWPLSDSCSWGQGVAATGVAVVNAVASGDNCEQYVRFYCNQNRSLPWYYSGPSLDWPPLVPTYSLQVEIGRASCRERVW